MKAHFLGLKYKQTYNNGKLMNDLLWHMDRSKNLKVLMLNQVVAQCPWNINFSSNIFPSCFSLKNYQIYISKEVTILL